jgi:murein L,D-transpeptidase YafK
LVRPLLAAAALAAAVALAGCDTDTPPALNGRHLQPISEQMLAEIERKNMSKESPILVRIFKEESELEVWKENRDGQFALLKTYPICRWSGELGPKIKEGDRQAPEGFYTITPGLMNPNSQYYLAINTGFPNAYDRANGRTGAFLMIHGDCSSRGCYAMTDEQIAEIYALAREAFFGGQKSFQIQAYPFRMTPANMARHRNSPHMAFWRMLKQGYDHFEVTRREPKVDVCERRYVFDAETNSRFSPTEKCPAYRVPQEIATLVREKQRRDDIQIAELTSRNVPTAPVRTGVDGGMNPVFLAALKRKDRLFDDNGRFVGIESNAKVPGTIPAHVNPPREPNEATGSTFAVASSDSKSVQIASANGSSGNFFSNLFSFGRSEPAPQQPAPAQASAPKPKAPQAKPAAPTVTAAAKPKTQTEPAQASTKSANAGAIRPAQPAQAASAAPKADAYADAQPSKPSSNALLNGAAPTVPAGGFENRFGSWR